MPQFAGRTANGIPRQALIHAQHPVLRVDGLVARALALTPADVARLPHEPYLGAISCLERGNVPDTDWLGVRLSDLLALAEPDASARYVRVSAGPYATQAPLTEAGRILLCDQLDGQPLAVERGGPWRIVVPDTRYYTSVKWVDRIEVTAETPDDSATRIAMARAKAREAKAAR